MKKICFLILFIVILSSCSNSKTKNTTKYNSSRTYMSNSEITEFVISDDKLQTDISNILTNECIKIYGQNEFNTSTFNIIHIDIESSIMKIYVQFLFSGYSEKDNFFLKQVSNEGQIAIIESNIIDNLDGTISLSNEKILHLSKNDNEYQQIVKDYFPQDKYLSVLKDREALIGRLLVHENENVEEYLSSINKTGMPYGDYVKYFSYKQ